jgi:ABC-type multidrug transport system permease subunit
MPIVFTSIGYWMCGLNGEFPRFLVVCLIMILNTNIALCFGAFLSTLAPTSSIAVSSVATMMTPLMIFGGVYLNNDSVPPYIIWLKYLSWVGFAYEVLIINQWDNIDFIPCPVTDSNSTICFNTGQDVINSLNMNKVNF